MGKGGGSGGGGAREVVAVVVVEEEEDGSGDGDGGGGDAVEDGLESSLHSFSSFLLLFFCIWFFICSSVSLFYYDIFVRSTWS